MTTAKKLISAAGAAAATGEATYVDDVFSTYLYQGNGSTKTITNGIALGDGPTNNTYLQIRGDGSISDESTFSHSLTLSSSMTTSTSVKKFGSGSMHFPYNATLATVSAPTDTAPRGTEDFTIEGWIYHSAANGSFRAVYASGYAIQIYVNSNNIIAYCSSASGSPSYFVNGLGGPTNSLQNNTWAHFAFVKNGSTFTVYVNGNPGTSTTSSTAVAAPSRSVIGGFSTTQYGLILNSGENAYIDDFRITRGRAVYTSSFTPPTAELDLDTTATGKGGLVWVKNRTRACSHALYDTERGPSTGTSSSTNKTLGTSLTSAEGIGGSVAGITSFNPDGFTTASDQISPYNVTGPSSEEYVSWTFRKQPGFFDVVTWTGDGTSNRNISHNLGSVPGCIIIKNLSISSAWVVYHRSLSSASYYLELNVTAAQALDGDQFSGTAPTDSVFTVGPNSGVNRSGDSFVAYLFAHDAQDFGTNSDESIIKCDSFTTDSSGNASINLGFEPQWILAKTRDSSNQWVIVDTMRGLASNGTGTDKHLWANSGNADMDYAFGHPSPNGFEITGLSGSQTYVYMAIRRPHKPASEFAATDMFNTGIGVSANPTFPSGFVTDMGLERIVGSTASNYIFSRLTGAGYHLTDSAGSESTGSSITWDYQDGMLDSFGSSTSYNWWAFKRVPGFFDVSTYTGDMGFGSTTGTFNHNLGVTPELIIIKSRDANYNWRVYFDIDSTNYEAAYLNANLASSTVAYTDGSDMVAQPTSSTFTLGTDQNVNEYNGRFLAYLFATAPGISKVGTFTRTSGDTTNVDCGFSNGARFVLFKRVTGGTGNWAVYDTYRGITTGNDPYFFLNSTAANVTSTDYIDPYSAGFTVASGIASGTFLFLAIA